MMEKSFPLEKFKLFETGPNCTKVRGGVLLSLSLYAYSNNPCSPRMGAPFLCWVLWYLGTDGTCELRECIELHEREDITENQRAMAQIWLQVRQREGHMCA